MLDLSKLDEAHIAERLSAELIAWLATTTRGNRPHAVPVWFAWRDPHVVVFSLPLTRKVRDLRRQPECTLALETAEVGTDVVIVEGRATMPSLDDADVRSLMDVFERSTAR
jgi:PPOX class probable F420-dependent enzyme